MYILYQKSKAKQNNDGSITITFGAIQDYTACVSCGIKKIFNFT